MLDLRNRNVLITGASTGFGEAAAVKFAARGAAVAIVARSANKLQKLAELIAGDASQVLAIPADLSDPGQIEEVQAEARKTLGPIEILVNNAGTNVAARSVAETSLDDWETVMRVNLQAPFHLAKLVLPDMKEAGRGTIVNVASRAAVFPSLLSGASYSSSKIGMHALNRILNEEANPYGVRSILIHPGVGDTPILDRRPEPPPMETRNRMLQAEDIAETIVFAAELPYRVCIEQMNVYPTDPFVG